jgi:alpha-1,3-glucan synthase
MFGATSFQITLLSGRNSQSDLQLYVLGAVFLAASFVWYTLFRLQPSVHVLSLPWLFFSLALFIIGIPALSSSPTGVHESMANVATWCYAAFSAAAFVYFGLNFGEEAVCQPVCSSVDRTDMVSQGSSTETWGRRACVVQGSQQIWVAVLWYWGNSLNGSSIARPPRWIVLIVWPLSLMGLAFSYLLRIGLPGQCVDASGLL